MKKPTTPKSENAEKADRSDAAAKPRVAGIVDGQTISHLRRERGDEEERAQAPLSFALIRRLLGFTGAYRRKMIALFITVALRGIQIPVLAWGVGAVINSPVARGDMRGLTWSVAAFTAFAAVGAVPRRALPVGP